MSFKESFVHWIIKYPKLCFLISLLVVFILSIGIPGLRGSYDIRSWFKKSDPDIINLNEFEKKFGHEDSIVIVLHNDNGILNTSSSQKISLITDRLKKLDQINRVESLTNYLQIGSMIDEINSQAFLEPPFENIDFIKKRKQLEGEPDLFGYLISQDLKTTLIYAYTESVQINTSITQNLATQAKKIIKEFTNEGDKLYLSGTIPITDAYREASSNDLIHLGPLALLVMFIAFLLIFKNPIIFIYPLLIILLSIIGSLGLAGILGFSFNNMTSALPVVLITIGMSDCVHILNWARYEKSDNMLLHSLLSNFSASILTSVSTAVGFFTLGFSEIPPVSEFGILGGFGCLLAWFLTYLLAPVCFKVIEKPLRRQAPSQINFLLAKKLHEFILKNNLKILVSFGLFSLIFLILSTFNTINSDMDDYFSKDFWAYTSIEFVKQEIGGINGPEIVVDSEREDGIKSSDFLQKVDLFQTKVDDIDMITRSFSVVNIIKKMNQVLDSDKLESYVIPDTQNSIAERLLLYSFSLPPGQSINQLYTVDNRAMKISLLQNSTSSEAGIELMNKIRSIAEDMNLKVSLEGTFSLIKRLSRIIVTTMIKSLGFSILLVSLLLVLFLKGPKILLFSLLPNLVPLAIAGGILYLTGTPVDMGSMIVFSVCFGIAVDDTIHFFVRYNDYQTQGYNTSDTIYLILNKTGSSLVYTSLILMSGFLTFSFASFLPNKNFGIFSAIVLIFALLVDLLMLPSLFLYFERKNK